MSLSSSSPFYRQFHRLLSIDKRLLNMKCSDFRAMELTLCLIHILFYVCECCVKSVCVCVSHNFYALFYAIHRRFANPNVSTFNAHKLKYVTSNTLFLLRSLLLSDASDTVLTLVFQMKTASSRKRRCTLDRIE